MCVCVLGSKCLTFLLLRDVFERSKCCLDSWLSCMFDCIHVCDFLFLKNYFKATSTAPRHLLTPGFSIELFSCFLSQSWYLTTTGLINRETFWPLDSSLIATSIHRAYFVSDTCLIDVSFEPFKARQILDTFRSIKNYWRDI